MNYEPYVRNKIIILLRWDFDTRYHEVTLLKSKHIRLKKCMKLEFPSSKNRVESQTLSSLIVIKYNIKNRRVKKLFLFSFDL